MPEFEAILKEARKRFQDEKYYDAIFPVETLLSCDCNEEAYISANATLYVFFEFIGDTRKSNETWEDLAAIDSLSIEELNIKIVEEFLEYGGLTRFQEKAKKQAEKICDTNLSAGNCTFETYFYKALLHREDIDCWLNFLNLALAKEDRDIDRILRQVGERLLWKGIGDGPKMLLELLQQFPLDVPHNRFLMAECQKELGNADEAIALYSGLTGTDYQERANQNLVSLYKDKGNTEKAIRIANELNHFSERSLVELHLANHDVEAAKVIIEQRGSLVRGVYADLFLRFSFFEEVLEELGNDSFPLDSYRLYTKVKALFGKIWLRGANVKKLEQEMLPVSTFGRELHIRQSSKGVDTPMPELVAQFYMMEARLYFLLNINYLKRKRKNLRDAEASGERSFGQMAFAYTHRTRLDEIHKEFKEKYFQPGDRQVDFRLHDYRRSFDKALRILRRAYDKVSKEAKQQDVQALIAKKEHTVDELWPLYAAYFEEEDYKKSREILERIESEQVGNPWVTMQKGHVAFKLGEHEEAIHLLEKAVGQFEKYYLRATPAHNLMQFVYAEMLEETDMSLDERSVLIGRLNASFSAWFQSDVELFSKLTEAHPILGFRRDDPIRDIAEKTIYKYCSFNMNTVSALSDEKVYFSRPQQLNDPFDMDGYLEAIKMDEYAHVAEEEKNKIACFCSTLQNDNLQMWAHYADSFAGLCIGYSIKSLPKEIAWRGVRYTDDKKANRALLDRLFVKSKNWAYEEEVRFVKFSDSPQLVSISPKRSGKHIEGHISEIIVGSRFDLQNNGPVLRAVLMQLNAKYDQIGVGPIKVLKAQESTNGHSDALDIAPISELDVS